MISKKLNRILTALMLTGFMVVALLFYNHFPALWKRCRFAG